MLDNSRLVTSHNFRAIPSYELPANPQAHEVTRRYPFFKGIHSQLLKARLYVLGVPRCCGAGGARMYSGNFRDRPSAGFSAYLASFGLPRLAGTTGPRP